MTYALYHLPWRVYAVKGKRSSKCECADLETYKLMTRNNIIVKVPNTVPEEFSLKLPIIIYSRHSVTRYHNTTPCIAFTITPHYNTTHRHHNTTPLPYHNTEHHYHTTIILYALPPHQTATQHHTHTSQHYTPPSRHNTMNHNTTPFTFQLRQIGISIFSSSLKNSSSNS